MRPQALREKPHPARDPRSGCDVRRIYDLFGITIDTAMRYSLILTHPDLEHVKERVPRTRINT